MVESTTLLAAYFNQQACLDTPPYIFSNTIEASSVLSSISGKRQRQPSAKYAAMPAKAPSGSLPHVKPAAPKSPVLPLPALKLGLPPSRTAFPDVTSTPMTEKRSKLAALFHVVKTCRECGLANLRNNFVFGTGNPDAALMIVGEAPGQEEDAQGQPFVGAAGELLTKMLAAISIDLKKQAFITNILKCKPQNNRDPQGAEILACSSILSRQIDIIAPQVILLLGKFAAHSLLSVTEPMAQLRQRTYVYRTIPVFVTYHPAALLRNDAYRRPAWEDLKKLKLKLLEIGLYDSPTR